MRGMGGMKRNTRLGGNEMKKPREYCQVHKHKLLTFDGVCNICAGYEMEYLTDSPIIRAILEELAKNK